MPPSALSFTEEAEHIGHEAFARKGPAVVWTKVADRRSQVSSYVFCQLLAGSRSHLFVGGVTLLHQQKEGGLLLWGSAECGHAQSCAGKGT